MLKVALRSNTLVPGLVLALNLALIFIRFGFKSVLFLSYLGSRINISLHILATAELFKHDHLVAAVFGGFCEQNFLLLILRCVNDIGPLLLVLGLERSEELVE